MLRRCAEGEAGLFLSPPNHVNVGCQPSGHFHALSLSFTGRARHANFSEGESGTRSRNRGILSKIRPDRNFYFESPDKACSLDASRGRRKVKNAN
ncbi:hypothetical protein J6590_005834 [Homalodisca vitripennis]|nr:hypothetical protein J6590_005834 [Homalodisca vitripennis]